jgi:hypothetical protein
MTKITKYLRSVDDIKKELEENPNNIRFYMGYMGFNSEDPNSIEFVEQKIEEYKNKQNESTKN